MSGKQLLFGWTKQQLLDFCLHNTFPGTYKWGSEHPIWLCNVNKYLSPKMAWYQENYLIKAINNLFYITHKSIEENKYPYFVKRVAEAFKTQSIDLLIEVLNRFTIAKIAPRVTALSGTTLYKILEETKIDLKHGVYCPMAGFGGIVEGSKKWFKKHKIVNNIEAYDINRNFCDWYGWGVRDILKQTIITDKIVIACPPFGKNTERWEGTPQEMYYEFDEWCFLIKEKIKAPNYILIGPETRKSKNICGLFSKTIGIQWYPEYSNL